MRNKATYNAVESRYGTVTVFANDTGAVTQSLLAYGEWAQNEINFLQRFVNSGSTVVDVGAYIGTHTLAFARLVGSAGRVIAIEAQPDTFNVLTNNVVANLGGDAAAPFGIVQLENAIATCELAQIDIPTIDIQHGSSFGSASLLKSLTNARGTSEDGKDEMQGCARVSAITIDSFNLDRCALIKLDVEGVEDMALRGAIQTLGRCSPLVYCECNTLAAGLKSLAVLEGVDYKVFAHVVNAFNPDNFYNREENFFGNAREVALVAIPKARAAEIRILSRCSSELLLDIEDADDLALALLNKPQYQSEVLSVSHAARTGGVEFLDQYSSASLGRLRNEARHGLEQQLQAAHDEDVALIQERDNAITELHDLLTQRDADIIKLQTLAEERCRDSAELHAILTQRDVEIAKLQDRISHSELELAELNSLLERRGADLAALEAILEQKDLMISEIRALLVRRDSAIDELVVHNAAKESELVRSNALISSLCASKSWKITKPLRWATGLLHGTKLIR